jgi:hypothetical protein
MAIGLVMAYAGKPMFRSITGVVGSFLGASLGFSFGGAIGGSLIGLLAAAAGALVGGAVMMYLVKFGLAILLGFLALFFLGIATGSIIIGIAAFFIVFILVIYFMDQVLLVVMAAGGALAVSFGVWIVTFDLILTLALGFIVFASGVPVQIFLEKQRKARGQPPVRTVIQPVYVPVRPPYPVSPPPPPPPPPSPSPPPPSPPPGRGGNFYRPPGNRQGP